MCVWGVRGGRGSVPLPVYGVFSHFAYPKSRIFPNTHIQHIYPYTKQTTKEEEEEDEEEDDDVGSIE